MSELLGDGSRTAGALAAVSDWLHPSERFWRDRVSTLSKIMEEDPEDE